MRKTLFVAGLIAAVTGAQPSGQGKESQTTRPRFGTSTAAVSVDVIVRDKHGRPVTDLTQPDFEVYEDGVRQKIVSFDRIVPSESSTPTAAATPANGSGQATAPPPDLPVRGQTAVALVFDWMSTQSRHEAWKAARTLLQDMQPGDYAAVYSIGNSLQRLIPFTSNTAALDRGFALALERPGLAAARENNSLANGLVKRPENSPTAAAEDGGVPESAVPDIDSNARGPDAQFAAMLKRIDDIEQHVNSEQQAWAGVDGLRALIEQMGVLYGRKTVVLFSEGLAITNSTVEKWQRLEDAANRLNISFYTFDAQGLRVQSPQLMMGRRLPSELTPSAGLYGDSTERFLGNMLGGPTRGLAELASATGGRYINNTNDLITPFHQVNMDRRYYYLLGYSSTNPSLDGSFRKITVKVHRPDVKVRSRAGYLAVPVGERTERRDFEAPALAALTLTPPPSAFPLRLRALSTPMPGHPGTTALVAALDAGALQFDTDDTARRYAGQATIVVRVVTASGKVVTTRSEHYNLVGDLPHLAKAKESEILFFAAPDLPPGPHVIEWAVRDDEADRASVARQQVTVPQGTAPMIGDLFVVAHTERAPKGKAVDGNPLAWDGLLLYPGFGAPISRAAQHELSFALPLVLGGAQASATMELVTRGQAVATLPLDLGRPDGSGRLVTLGRLPLASIPPGSYELRVTVTAGDRREVRSAEFTVVP